MKMFLGGQDHLKALGLAFRGSPTFPPTATTNRLHVETCSMVETEPGQDSSSSSSPTTQDISCSIKSSLGGAQGQEKPGIAPLSVESEGHSMYRKAKDRSGRGGNASGLGNTSSADLDLKVTVHSADHSSDPWYEQTLLSELPATAIAGNDLLSSCLYTMGLCSVVAGRWTPLAMLVVTFGILRPFRRIYADIGTFLPQNGGSFNCIMHLAKGGVDMACSGHGLQELSPLLQASKDSSPSKHKGATDSASSINGGGLLDGAPSSPSKRTFGPGAPAVQAPPLPLTRSTLLAVVTGVLSLLSYIATAVVSAATAIIYGVGEFPHFKPYEFYLTLTVLVVFGLLTLLGLKESSRVATWIFLIHCSMMSVVVVGGLLHSIFALRGATWLDNFTTPDSTAKNELNIGMGDGFSSLFFGVATALLGITGFETSSNYIEEQAPGVFPKTLRNMWILVTVFNPLLSVVSLGVIPMAEFRASRSNLLSLTAERAISPLFRKIFATDAVLALSGGALTAYIGVIGLIMRMAQEGMFPALLLSRNRAYGTYHYIILIFMSLTSMLYIGAKGRITALGAVYTISFLGVLGLATVGCIVIRYKTKHAGSPAGGGAAGGGGSGRVWSVEIFAALIAVLLGILAQAILAPRNFLIFCYYFFGVTGGVWVYMYNRKQQAHAL